LYWGAVGAIRELVERLADQTKAVEVFLTGGAAGAFAPILERESQRTLKFVPHLTLAGVALAAWNSQQAEA
jgi:pantothenate kinase type III